MTSGCDLAGVMIARGLFGINNQCTEADSGLHLRDLRGSEDAEPNNAAFLLNRRRAECRIDTGNR